MSARTERVASAIVGVRMAAGRGVPGVVRGRLRPRRRGDVRTAAVRAMANAPAAAPNQLVRVRGGVGRVPVRTEAVAALRELGTAPVMATRLDEQLRALAGAGPRDHPGNLASSFGYDVRSWRSTTRRSTTPRRRRSNWPCGARRCWVRCHRCLRRLAILIRRCAGCAAPGFAAAAEAVGPRRRRVRVDVGAGDDLAHSSQRCRLCSDARRRGGRERLARPSRGTSAGRGRPRASAGHHAATVLRRVPACLERVPMPEPVHRCRPARNARAAISPGTTPSCWMRTRRSWQRSN